MRAHQWLSCAPCIVPYPPDQVGLHGKLCVCLSAVVMQEVEREQHTHPDFQQSSSSTGCV